MALLRRSSGAGCVAKFGTLNTSGLVTSSASEQEAWTRYISIFLPSTIEPRPHSFPTCILRILDTSLPSKWPLKATCTISPPSSKGNLQLLNLSLHPSPPIVDRQLTWPFSPDSKLRPHGSRTLPVPQTASKQNPMALLVPPSDPLVLSPQPPSRRHRPPNLCLDR